MPLTPFPRGYIFPKVVRSHSRAVDIERLVPTGSLPSVTLTITGFSISVILPLQERSTNVAMQQVP